MSRDEMISMANALMIERFGKTLVTADITNAIVRLRSDLNSVIIDMVQHFLSEETKDLRIGHDEDVNPKKIAFHALIFGLQIAINMFTLGLGGMALHHLHEWLGTHGPSAFDLTRKLVDVQGGKANVRNTDPSMSAYKTDVTAYGAQYVSDVGDKTMENTLNALSLENAHKKYEEKQDQKKESAADANASEILCDYLLKPLAEIKKEVEKFSGMSSVGMSEIYFPKLKNVLDQAKMANTTQAIQSENLERIVDESIKEFELKYKPNLYLRRLLQIVNELRGKSLAYNQFKRSIQKAFWADLLVSNKNKLKGAGIFSSDRRLANIVCRTLAKYNLVEAGISQDESTYQVTSETEKNISDFMTKGTNQQFVSGFMYTGKEKKTKYLIQVAQERDKLAAISSKEFVFGYSSSSACMINSAMHLEALNQEGKNLLDKTQKKAIWKEAEAGNLSEKYEEFVSKSDAKDDLKVCGTLLSYSDQGFQQVSIEKNSKLKTPTNSPIRTLIETRRARPLVADKVNT